MNKNDLIKYYEDQLESLGYAADDNGLLDYADGGAPARFTYGGKNRRMGLPTTKLIREGLEWNGEEIHTYHPMSESMLAAESGTIRFLKKSIRMAIWYYGTNLVNTIIKAHADGRAIKSNPYKHFMAKVCADIKSPQLDEKLASSWASVLEYLNDEKKTPPQSRVRLAIASNEKIGEDRFARVANYAHIFQEESDDGKATYFGARCLRKQDKSIIHSLLTTVFGWYPAQTGSNDNRAYYGSLIRGWAKFVEEYNKVAGALHEHYADMKPLNDAWLPLVDGMDVFDNMIQTLPYNTGPDKTGVDNSKQYALGALPSVSPAEKPKTAPTTEDGKVDPMAVFSAHRPKVIGGLFGNSISAANRSPAWIAEYERTGVIPKEHGEVRSVSLAAALGQSVPQQAPSLLTSNMSLASALGGTNVLGGIGGSSSLGGPAVLGATNPLGGIGSPGILGQSGFTF